MRSSKKKAAENIAKPAADEHTVEVAVGRKAGKCEASTCIAWLLFVENNKINKNNMLRLTKNIIKL